MTPTEIVRLWIDRFNHTDIEALAELYVLNALHDQVVFSKPLRGQSAIRHMFELVFSRAKMVCIEEHMGTSQNQGFCVRARKLRAEDRSVWTNT